MVWNFWRRYLLGALVSVALYSGAGASEWKQRLEVGALFAKAGVEGTFVAYDVTNDAFIGHNFARAKRRYIPASTFKIPHTLLGLACGVMRSVGEVLPYTGPKKPFIAAWGHDMGLREAIALSNVPIYRELARRIGLERMHEGLIKIPYGNAKIGTSVDTFWLRGPLEISAVEQVEFLAELAQGRLPFAQKLQREVCAIVPLEKGKGWMLRAKTGWQNAPDPGVGWWVGWVEAQGGLYAFALNMRMRNAVDADKRAQLGKASLRVLGII